MSKNQAEQMALDTISTGDPTYSHFYVQRIQAVTPAQVLAVARKYLRPDGITTAIVQAAQHNCRQARDGFPFGEWNSCRRWSTDAIVPLTQRLAGAGAHQSLVANGGGRDERFGRRARGSEG